MLVFPFSFPFWPLFLVLSLPKLWTTLPEFSIYSNSGWSNHCHVRYFKWSVQSLTRKSPAFADVCSCTNWFM